jgi:hypothetical protein
MHRRLVGLLVPLVAAAASCSNVKIGHTLDASSAGRQIAGSLATTTGLAAPPVHCPKGIQVRTGQTFDCTTNLEGQPVTVHVTLNDNRGQFTFKPASAILIVARAASAIKTNVDQQTGGPTTVDCGTRQILVLAPGATFPCTALAAGVSRTVTVTVSDLQGNVRFQLAPPAEGSPPISPTSSLPSSLSTVPGGG